MHRVLIDLTPAVGRQLTITGEEARHAVRVKRLEPGEPIELLNARGMVARAIVEPGERSTDRAGRKSGPKGDWTLTVRVEHVEQRPRVMPQIHVLSAAPKGERLVEMIDALSQVGAASWSPLECIRSVAEPRAHKLERLERIVREAAKQCGRPWSLDLHSPGHDDALAGSAAASASTTLTDALARPAPVLMADASAPPLSGDHLPRDATDITLLVGPEGGWDPREVHQARAAGATHVSFGPHIMRIEQAAVVGAALALHLARTHSRTA